MTSTCTNMAVIAKSRNKKEEKEIFPLLNFQYAVTVLLKFI